MINNMNSGYFPQYSQQIPVYAQNPIQNRQVYPLNIPFSHYPNMLQNHCPSPSIPYSQFQSAPVQQNQSIDPHSVVSPNRLQVNWVNSNQYPTTHTHNPYHTSLPSQNYVSVTPQTGTLPTITNCQPQLTYTYSPQSSIFSPTIQTIPGQNIKSNQFYYLSVQSEISNYETVNPPSTYGQQNTTPRPDPYSFLSKDLSQNKASPDIRPDSQKSPSLIPSDTTQMPTLKMGRIEITTNQLIPTSNEKFQCPLIQKSPTKPKSLSEFEDFGETFINLFATDNGNLYITANSETMDVSPDITSPNSEKVDLSPKSDSSQKVPKFVGVIKKGRPDTKKIPSLLSLRIPNPYRLTKSAWITKDMPSEELEYRNLRGFPLIWPPKPLSNSQQNMSDTQSSNFAQESQINTGKNQRKSQQKHKFCTPKTKKSDNEEVLTGTPAHMERGEARCQPHTSIHPSTSSWDANPHLASPSPSCQFAHNANRPYFHHRYPSTCGGSPPSLSSFRCSCHHQCCCCSHWIRLCALLGHWLPELRDAAFEGDFGTKSCRNRRDVGR